MTRNRLIASVAFASVLWLGCIGQAFAHALWWTKPTTYDDGAPISATDTVSTLIEWSDGATFGAVDGTRTVAAAGSATVPDPTSTRCYRVRAVVAGIASAPSNVWCKVIGAPAPSNVPSAPTGLSGN